MTTQSKRAPRWRRGALEAMLLIAIVLAIGQWRKMDLATGPAPSLIGYDLDGKLVRLEPMHDGPVLVHFWATWCPVCRAQDDAIDAIARDHRVVTVAMQSGGEDAIEAYLSDHGLSFPTLADPDASLARAWGVKAVPASFVVGRDDQIHFREVGFTTSWGLRLRLWWVAWAGG